MRKGSWVSVQKKDERVIFREVCYKVKKKPGGSTWKNELELRGYFLVVFFINRKKYMFA